ncbi:MAG: hypothetical protein C9356_20155 [Oleiphilus sp.]|nr:MAG: hypothetical protein C9356_20155 [Oleiphilus sp.]
MITRLIAKYINLQNLIGDGSAPYSIRLFLLQLTATLPVSLFTHAFIAVHELFKAENTLITSFFFVGYWLIGTLFITAAIWFGQSGEIKKNPHRYGDFKQF